MQFAKLRERAGDGAAGVPDSFVEDRHFRPDATERTPAGERDGVCCG